ncbi:MAG: hypothetical protein GY940_24500 [bacterium]|nr:hypothetical protein [bacterium]
MSIAIQISDQLIQRAQATGSMENRTLTGQIEYWAKIGKCAEENPDLTFSLIKEILNGLEELKNGEGTEYQFG